jgi:hypothetical protein
MADLSAKKTVTGRRATGFGSKTAVKLLKYRRCLAAERAAANESGR